MEREQLVARIAAIREELGQLEEQLTAMETAQPWQPPPNYLTYQVMAGCVLGMFGAAVSLLFNVIGSLVAGLPPLKLIQIYLTFPLGKAAESVDDGLTLAIGCCLYLATGMVLGVPFQLALSRCKPGTPWSRKFFLVTGLSLALWICNYYLILAWLQPLLFGGNWIVRDIPPWVAAATHLVFGWTMLLVQPLGAYTAARPSTEAA
jgi:hypothetical protein